MSNKDSVKCRYCGKIIMKADAYKVGKSTYYCSLLCQNSAEQKRLNKERKNYKSIKGTDRRLVTDKIVKIYTDKGVGEQRIPWDMIGAQMKNMLDEHQDWDYKTLYLALWYMVDILEMDLLNDSLQQSPLSLVPYYVLEAQEYYDETKRINEIASKFEIPDVTIMKATRGKPKQRFKKITF